LESLIAIPSRARSGSVAKGTLRYIPDEWHPQTKFFVPEEEQKKYKNALWNTMHEQVEAVPSKGQDISICRKEIGEYAAANGFKKFMMLDDDLTAWAVRPRPSVTDLKAIHPKSPEIYQMFNTVDLYLNFFAHVGVSPRGNNHGLSSPDDTPNPYYYENKRIIRFLAYQTDLFNSCEHGRVAIAEDFDVTLQLLTRGYKNCVFYQWTQDQMATNLPGGCSVYRTLKLHEENMEKLHKLWPEFTKLRIKENVDKEAIKLGLATRLEITIEWVKAWESSQTNLASTP